ncbi:hypothetical protein DVH24_036724 [Malus domestica]|uniref:Uncharacterized protein n=1 Tax=Malus domestica TaxID=3750 RepID=A0A498IMC8_MALDO|nr:hypothetical protein DVH24_036724 [Malus domestica]
MCSRHNENLFSVIAFISDSISLLPFLQSLSLSLSLSLSPISFSFSIRIPPVHKSIESSNPISTGNRLSIEPLSSVSPANSFKGGLTIIEEFFREKITGGHNEYLCGILLPNWDIERITKPCSEGIFRNLSRNCMLDIKCIFELMLLMPQEVLQICSH